MSTLALAAQPHVAAMHHMMSPAIVVIVLVVGALLDWSAFGPDSYRDRIAFLLYTTGIYEGWNGGPADAWTLEQVRKALVWALSSSVTRGSYIAGAAAGVNVIIGALVGITFVYALVCVLPPFAQTWLSKKKFAGTFVVRSFPSSATKRMNWKLIAMAIVLGLFSDVPQGWIGHPAMWCLQQVDGFVAMLFTLIFVWG